ncbi:MAG: OmpA family protein [Bacteroidales bacterium]|nr:OmpA family protein [Bacteroidales bacterium]
MKKITIILIAIACSTLVFAQANEARTATNESIIDYTVPTHEFSVFVGGGISWLRYGVDNAQQRGRFGGDLVGFGYSYLFPRRSDQSVRWGIHTGIGLGLYRTRTTLTNAMVESGILHDVPYNDPFILRTTVLDYTENQRALLLQIPLMAQLNFGERFYTKAGFKFGIPVMGRFSAEGEVHNRAWYPSLANYAPDFTPMGLGRFSKEADGNIDLGFSAMLALEAGMRFRVSETLRLHAGVFFNYGLNNIYRGDQNQTFAVQETANGLQSFQKNSILTQFTNNSQHVRPVAVGINLRLAFGGRRVTRTEPAPAPVVVAPALVQPQPQPVVQPEERVVQQPPVVEPPREEPVNRQEIIRTIEEPIGPFPIGGAELSAAQRQNLDEKVVLLRQYPNIRLHIYGHTCDLGSTEVNERIGLQRAQSVKDYMVSEGVAANRITISSKRYTEPLVPNTSEENRRQNRRVEIVVIELIVR